MVLLLIWKGRERVDKVQKCRSVAVLTAGQQYRSTAAPHHFS